jgi:hypothetical protein
VVQLSDWVEGSCQHRRLGKLRQNHLFGGKECYGSPMSNSQTNTGTVDVDGLRYNWQLQRDPQWSDNEGWKGMAISLLQRDTQRAALLEFPPPKRLLKGLPRGRLQLDDATISRGVRAALEAGWDPMSRGKPMVFTVDSEGN